MNRGLRISGDAVQWRSSEDSQHKLGVYFEVWFCTKSQEFGVLNENSSLIRDPSRQKYFYIRLSQCTQAFRYDI